MSHEILADIIKEYQSVYRGKNLPRFEFGEIYDLFPEETTELNPSSLKKWPEGWPLPDRAGVYIFLDNKKNIIYIGKASFNSCLAARLTSYCRYESGRGSRCRLVHDWKIKPRYIVTIAVPESSRFEASSLEEYLILKIQPPENRVGVRAIKNLSVVQN